MKTTESESVIREKLLANLRELVAFQSALQTPHGQAVMEHLRRVTCADKSSYRGGDPHATSYACGLRDAYLLMVRDAEKPPTIAAEKLKHLEDETK